MNLQYIWNKFFKKMAGRAVLNSEIHKTSKVEADSVFINSTMDRYSFCGYDCKIINCDIGAFTSIADGVIVGGARHPIEWASTSPVFYGGRDSIKKKMAQFQRTKEDRSYIGNDVWIGDRAIIKAGVQIGNGAVIGMGSIVTKDVGPYEIWGGNPAKLIRKRFSDETIKKFQNAQWWLLPDEKIELVADKVMNPTEFIDELLIDKENQ